MNAGATEKPQYPPLDVDDFQHLPVEMRNAKRWMLWRLSWNEKQGKWLKVPFYSNGNKRTGEQNSHADWDKLATFEQVWAAYNAAPTRWDGVGFACGPDDTGNYWQAIDLDKIPKRPHLQLIADEMPGFSDDSPSGTGRHAYGYGRAFKALRSNPSGIEAFCPNQFITVTCANAGGGEIECLADYVEKVLTPQHERASGKPALVPVLFAPGHDKLADGRRCDLYAAGCKFYETGARGAELFRMIRGYNLANYDPPKSEAEVRETAENVAKHSNTAKQEKTLGDAWGFVWGDTLTDAANLKPSEWTIYKVLPKECTGLLYGEWGTFKTFVMLDMAGAVQSGTPWHGKATQQGTVFYLAGEGEQGFARRLKAWEVAHGTRMSNLAFREMPRVRNKSELSKLQTFILKLAKERGGPRLIVLDTLFTALDGGDENSGKDMGEVFSAMRELRQAFSCAVIAVHHTGHEGTRARGHSSMPAGVDVQFHLKCKESGQTSVLELINVKQKDGKKCDPTILVPETVQLPGLLDENGEVEESVVIRAPAMSILEAMAKRESRKADDVAQLKLKAAELRADGKTIEEIAKQVGRDKSTVSRWFPKELAA